MGGVIVKYLMILIICLFSIQISFASISHDLFTEILQDYVISGNVNYKSLCQDDRFEKYIKQLVKTNPDTIQSEKDRLAFWINAYNAYTLKIICDNYPIESINDLHSGGLVLGLIFSSTIWDKDFVIINNKPTTLNAIEHDTIRPLYNDPRAHFALVCASKSCPPLRSEAYEGDKLDEQLNDQGKIFLSDSQKNNFDISEKTAKISKIFDWFDEDFGEDEADILLFLADYLPEDSANLIRNNPHEWDVEYLDYDWSLNE